MKEHKEDLSYLFTLCDLRMSFTDQYFTQVPIYLVLAILKIVEDEMELLDYLKEKVYPKLTAGSSEEDDGMEGEISFEEILLLRLTQDITRQQRNMRLPEFVDGLQALIPDFDLYKQVFWKIKSRKTEISATQTPGFVNRAILSEWVKYALHLNLEDEVVRN